MFKTTSSWMLNVVKNVPMSGFKHMHFGWELKEKFQVESFLAIPMSAGPNAIHQRTKNITKPCTQNSESILSLIVCQKALILFTSFAQLLYSSCFILLKIFLKKIGFSISIPLNLILKPTETVKISRSVQFRRFDSYGAKEINSFYKVFTKLKNYWYSN